MVDMKTQSLPVQHIRTMLLMGTSPAFLTVYTRGTITRRSSFLIFSLDFSLMTWFSPV